MRMPRILATFVAVTALVVGVIVPVTAAQAAPSAGKGVHTLKLKMSLDGFDAGNIISDAVFTDRNTMTEAQIQAFFNSKVSRCQGGSDKWGPIICLKDFTISSVNRPADRYCQGYTGAPNESAARIIYRVAQSCGINPQVLIVMLQKEQGLVTHTWPSMNRYNAALGQGCPDGGVPCDPSYVGFFHQIYGAARQMQIYMEGRYFTYYAPGRTWNILYNPNRACGSSPVYVANGATSALYYYTPYQPNAAAMRAGYGEGDGCSAYGNRNFYNYFTDWFGSTKSSGARVLKDSATGASFLVVGTVKYSFPTAERAVQFTWISPTQTVSTAQLAGFTNGGVAPRAVRTDQHQVFLLDSGRRFRIPTCELAADYGWSCATLPVVAQGQVNAYPDAGYLTPTVRGLAANWLIQGGVRREIVDQSILLQYGMSPSVSVVADALVNEYSLGDPVLGAGVYGDPAGKTVAVLQGGSTYDVSAQGQVDAVRAATRPLSTASIGRLKIAGTLPLTAKVDGVSYVLGNDGWIASNAYGTAVPFASLPTRALASMPQAAAANGPHFVRERSSLQVFLVSGGVLQAVNAEEQRWITAAYGVSAQIRVIADSALGKSSTAGSGVVKTPEGAVYLIDGTNRYRFLTCAQVADWGRDCAQLPVVAASQVSQITDRGSLTHLVRKSDGTTWLVQSGSRREVVDASVLAPYGIGAATTTLSNSLVEPLTVGAPVLSPGAYSDGAAAIALVNPAGAFSVSAENRIPVIVGGVRKLTAASYGLLGVTQVLPSRLVSDGKAMVLTDQGWLQVDPAQYGGTQLFTTLASNAWLGVPLAGSDARPHFVRESASAQMFLVSGGYLQPVENDAALSWIVARFGVSSKLWKLADGTLKSVPLSMGIVFRDGSERALLSSGTTYFQFSSCAAAAGYGTGCDGAPTIAPEQLGMTNSGVLASLLKSPDGALWLVQSNQRREVPDPSVLAQYGIGSGSTAVPAALVSSFALGAPVVTAGPYRNPSGAVRLVTATGKVVDVPVDVRVDAITAKIKNLSDASFTQLSPTGTLTARAEAGGSYYVLSAQGWVGVSRANFGSLAFTSTTADVIAAVPSAGTATGPRFVKEWNSAQVYLASGGLTPVTAEEQATISRLYGVPSTVLVLATGALR
ncbi:MULTISPECIES: hypothetical protein [unclassified Microbacterium]|uniref:hypothetical protein n=1 Tax=unclassified Microbacterium TaxID=2609290 RepID=UPI003435638F